MKVTGSTDAAKMTQDKDELHMFCEQLYEEVALPAHIRAHCLAVGDLSGWMAERLTEHGALLDIELCRSGGYLHDLMRLAPDHPAAAAAFLRSRGYPALADVVKEHMSPEKPPDTICDAAAIVFLADKLIRETERVTLRERYQKALRHRDVRARVLRDIGLCERLISEFEEITGEKLVPSEEGEESVTQRREREDGT